MAPFKLKFRMGSSRSTSQEHDPDPQVNEALLGTQHQEQQQSEKGTAIGTGSCAATVMGASSSTIDSADCNSLGSMGNNASERKLLLPGKASSNTNSLRLGYINQSRTACINESPTDETNNLPTTPPPSYEHVLEENTRMSQHQRQLSSDSATPNQNSRRSSANSSRHSVNLSAALDQLSLNTTGNHSNSASAICNDPDCQQNYSNNCASSGVSSTTPHNNNNEDHHIIEGVTELEVSSCNEHEIECSGEPTISVNEFLLETEMAAGADAEHKLYAACSGEECQDAQCSQCNEEGACGGDSNIEAESEATTSNAVGGNFYDPGNYRNFNEVGNALNASLNNGQPCTEACCLSSQSRMRRGRGLQQNCHTSNLLSPELMSNKTSKEIYKDLAKQWGITCKMSESCRCMECQSHYFDCDYEDQGEQQKTDGGLGAGTPMFISEVMHGSACNIL